MLQRLTTIMLAVAIVFSTLVPTAYAVEDETWSGNTEILIGYPGVIAIDDPRLDFEITDDMYVVVYSLPRWNDTSSTNGKITRRAFMPTFDLTEVGHEKIVRQGYWEWCAPKPNCRTVKIFISDQEFKVVQYPIDGTINTM